MAYGLHVSRPVLIALMGLPGAGKSTVAAALAGATRVSRDAVRASWGAPLGYGEEDKAVLFRAVLFQAGAVLSAGQDVVLDGMPFSRETDRVAAMALAAEHGAGFVAVLLDLRVEEARRRVAGEGAHEAADRSAALVDEVAGRFTPPDPSVLVLDATRPVAELAARIREAVESARGV